VKIGWVAALLGIIAPGCCLTIDLGQCTGTSVVQEKAGVRTTERQPARGLAPQSQPNSTAVRDHTPPPSAQGEAIRLEVFTDLECAYCRRLHPTLERLRQEYGNRLQVIIRHLPLNGHPRARPAARAALAAEQQGKLWPMLEVLFEDPAHLVPDQYPGLAQRIGLDVDRFQRALHSAGVNARLESDAALARRLQTQSTPTLFINGRRLVGAKPYQTLSTIVQQELQRRQAIQHLNPR